MAQSFEQAVEEVKTLSSSPSNEILLKLYALYKQSTQGDATGKRPGLLDLRGRAKFDAWLELKGLTPEQAQKQYIDLVNRLINDD